jgi:hypothetical protein
MRQVTRLGESAFCRSYSYGNLDLWSSDHDPAGFETPAASVSHLSEAHPEKKGERASLAEASPGKQD